MCMPLLHCLQGLLHPETAPPFRLLCLQGRPKETRFNNDKLHVRDGTTVASHLDKRLAQRGGVAVLQRKLEVVVRDGQSVEHLLHSPKKAQRNGHQRNKQP